MMNAVIAFMHMIYTVIRHAMCRSSDDEPTAECTELLDKMRHVEQNMNTGLLDKFTLSLAQRAAVEACVSFYGPVVYKGWETKWIYM